MIMEIMVKVINSRVMSRIKHILLMFVMVTIGCLIFGINAKAYTEEEKAQAKAWLSAHGYSPDAGGASAAYQDYLNGKFDEELGITREETTGSPQSAYEDDSDEKSEKTTETQTKINSAWDFMQQKGTEQQTEATTETTTEATTETVTEEASTQIAYEEDEESDDEDEEDTEAEENTEAESEDTSKKGTSHMEAVVVIVLSVLIIIIGFGAFTLLKK